MTATVLLSGSTNELKAKETYDAQGDLAWRHKPVLMLDAREPYAPVAMGYTVFENPGQSPSSKFQVMPVGGPVIEYAIWYDWDIQHMYDLEHVWVYLNADGRVAHVEASRHGKRLSMGLESGQCRLQNDRPVLYSEPGKHAHWGNCDTMRQEGRRYIAVMCKELAGFWGVHEGNFFCESGRIQPTAFDHRLVRLKLKADAFEPSFEFTRSGDDGAGTALVPWDFLERWIPARVRHVLAALPEKVPHIKAVLFDCGDTIADEATEVKLPGSEVVTSADFIPGAQTMVRNVHQAGYRMALVADGPRKTFENILKPARLWDLFDAHIISGDIGELKPSPKMFGAALDALEISCRDAGRIVMIGNNLSRDIKGANDFGLLSIFFGWSRRRTHTPEDTGETPDHTIYTPSDLLPLLNAIEEDLARDPGGAA